VVYGGMEWLSTKLTKSDCLVSRALDIKKSIHALREKNLSQLRR